jgi:hypothetical protein
MIVRYITSVSADPSIEVKQPKGQKFKHMCRFTEIRHISIEFEGM